MPKYKDILVKKVEKENDYNAKQKKLKKRYRINRDNVIIVEKNNVVIKLLGKVIRLVIWILLLSLAALGLISLVYPDVRQQLLKVLLEAVNQFKLYTRFKI